MGQARDSLRVFRDGWLWPTALALLVLFLTFGAAVAQNMRPVPRPERVFDSPAVASAMPSVAPVPRPAGLLVGHEFQLALAAVRAGNWESAAALATGRGDAAPQIIDWMALRAGRGSFGDYRRFLAHHGDWPGLKLLRKKGEAAISAEASPADVVAYFKPQPPQTGTGALRLAAALVALGRVRDANAQIVRAWVTLDLGPKAEAAFLKDYAGPLKANHAKRLDHLLWARNRAAAARMLPLVSAGWQALAQARMALQRKSRGVDTLIAAVPRKLAGDPGLAYDRMTWRIAQRHRDTAADLMLERSVSAAALGRPDIWANWRRILARQEMRNGNAARAYALASKHRLTTGSDYADLEWLSGYLALRYLDQPARALTHFKNFRAAVYTPISLGRAGYWQGRALGALGQPKAALAAFRDAGRYQTSFYGLLGAERAGMAMDPALTGRSTQPVWAGAGFTRSEVFRAAALFQGAGKSWEAGRFLRHLATSLSPADLVLLSEYAASLGDPHLAVRVGKQVAREGTVVTRAYFPLTRLGDSLPVPEALALSIARRESEFRASAVSGVGARGLMQLMPKTARAMAGKLGLPYSSVRLTSDPAYNAQLGSAYLAQLIEEFGQNYLLVAAGYNAGPHRARRWIETLGDPRAAGVDAVDWIEHIPFRETRNYVMRVMESVPVYRARLSGRPESIRLSLELKAR